MSAPPPFTGEPLALDLVNTRPQLADGPADLLADLGALRAWLRFQSDRLDEDHDGSGSRWERLGAQDLRAVHTVRDDAEVAIERARRGERPPETALRRLTETQRALRRSGS